MEQPQYAVGVDLGGTNVRVGLVDAAGQLIAHAKRPTPVQPGGLAILDAIVAEIRALMDKTGIRPAAVGVGTAGQVDWRQGSIAFCTDHLPGWSGVKVKRLLEDALGVPSWVDNDANAAMYGEFWQGAARGLRHACLITLGTGLGGGFLVAGQILRGARGRAVEVGHTILVFEGEECNCGQRGCWEMYVAGKAVRRMAREALAAPNGPASALRELDPEKLSSHEVFAAARAGDHLAGRVIDRQAGYVAAGVAGLINLFDPEAVLIGGGMSATGDFLLARVKRALAGQLGNGHQGEDPVRLAALGDTAGLIGAAGIALGELAARAPSPFSPPERIP